jgi:hypothetical protein
VLRIIHHGQEAGLDWAGLHAEEALALVVAPDCSVWRVALPVCLIWASKGQYYRLLGYGYTALVWSQSVLPP